MNLLREAVSQKWADTETTLLGVSKQRELGAKHSIMI